MRLKKLHGQDGRNNMSLEAKVYALYLYKVEEHEPSDIVEELEERFDIKVAASNWQRPKRFLRRIEQSILKLLEQEDNVHRSRLIKLLKQYELIDGVS